MSTVTVIDDYRRVVVQLTHDGREARLQVLAFARQGVTVRDIADRMGLSEQVVTVLLGLKSH